MLDPDPALTQALLASDLRKAPFVNARGAPLLSEAAVAGLARKAVRRAVAPLEVVIRQGEPGHAAYVILSGRARAVIQSPDHTDAVEVGPGALIGEMSLMTGLPRSATVTATTPAELAVLSREAFAALLAAGPEVPSRLAGMVARRSRHALDALVAARDARGARQLGARLRPRRLVQAFHALMGDYGLWPEGRSRGRHAITDGDDAVLAGLLLDSDFCQRLLRAPDGAPLLRERDLAGVAPALRQMKLAEGDVLHRQGEAGDDAFVVVHGALRVSVESGLGDAVFELGPGALVGEMSLLTGLPRSATVSALFDTELLVLGPGVLASILSLRPEIPEILARLAADRLRAISERLQSPTEDEGHDQVARRRLQRVALERFGWFMRLPVKFAGAAAPVDRGREALKRKMERSFLTGNFAPVRDEVEVEGLEVIEGRIPEELEGLYLRNGPNPQFAPPDLYHWFDGDGMVHAVRLRGGRAEYYNRWIRTKGWQCEREEGRAIWPGMFTSPRLDCPHGLAMKNLANTALVWHAGQLLALWEAGEPHALKVPGIETIGPYSFRGRLSFSMTAHPKIDPATGEMMFFGFSPTMRELQYNVAGAGGEIEHSVTMPLAESKMMHDFAITERYAVFIEPPMVFHVGRLLTNQMWIEFDRAQPLRIGVLPRRGAAREIRWFETPPSMVVHTANAWEEGDEVVLVAYRMENPTLLIPPETIHDVTGDLRLWRMNMRTGAVREESVSAVEGEFPTIDGRWTGRRNKHLFAARVLSKPDPPRPMFDGVLKIDLTSGASTSHALGPGRFGGEFTFVPRPGGSADDDGWLLGLIHDETSGCAELLILDARDMAEAPVARVRIPRRVPYGFHGLFIPERDLG